MRVSERIDPLFFENEIVDVNDVSKALNKSPQTIRRWCQRSYKGIPMQKLGSTYKGTRKQILVWIEQSTKGELL